jgi:transposase
MNYVGVDIHKRYSVLVATDERGRELIRGRVNGNTAFGFAQFFSRLEGPSKVVLEACWNWGRIHDLLQEIEAIEQIVLAHPLKTRLIADAQIKTDTLDASALATLLRGDLIARAYVPGRATRQITILTFTNNPQRADLIEKEKRPNDPTLDRRFQRCPQWISSLTSSDLGHCTPATPSSRNCCLACSYPGLSRNASLRCPAASSR